MKHMTHGSWKKERKYMVHNSCEFLFLLDLKMRNATVDFAHCAIGSTTHQFKLE